MQILLFIKQFVHVDRNPSPQGLSTRLSQPRTSASLHQSQEDPHVEIYIIRHGESINNWFKKANKPSAQFERSVDPPLTSLGEAQARRAAEALVGSSIERVYCSPQIRGLQTGVIIGDRLGVPVEARPFLRERAGGHTDYHGLPAAQIRARFPQVELGPDFTEEGWWFRPAEPRDTDATYRRGLEVAEWLWSLTETYDSVALISHGAFGARMMLALLGLPADSSVRFKQENGGISRLVLEEGMVRCIYWNDTRHMRELGSDVGAEAAV